MTGTLINAAAVIVGGSIGLVVHTRLPKRIIEVVFQGIGLFTILIGISMAIDTSNFLLVILSMVTGSVIGEWIDIEKSALQLCDYLKRKVKSKNEKFAEGMTTAFLLFCVGSLTILGAIEEGLSGNPNLLITKSALDGFASVGLAAALGAGVLFSVIPLLIYQGGLTLLAGFLQGTFDISVVGELSAVGGLLLMGLGINILEIKKLRILNMLPAMVIVVILSQFFL